MKKVRINGTILDWKESVELHCLLAAAKSYQEGVIDETAVCDAAVGLSKAISKLPGDEYETVEITT